MGPEERGVRLTRTTCEIGWWIAAIVLFAVLFAGNIRMTIDSAANATELRP